MHEYWTERRGTPDAWLGGDLLDGMFERYVGRVITERPDTLHRLRGRSAIFLANHQVQIESLLISNLLPALTDVAMTTVSNVKHKHRWIGEMVRLLEAYPGARTVEQIAYFDQSDPGSMFDLIDGLRRRQANVSHSFFVHTDGTRAQSCRQPTTRCSSVFLDMALELDLPIVPVRFTGGLPVTPIGGKAEFPHDHAAQDYWIGEPIEAAALRAMPLRDRVEHVVSAINRLGGSNTVEQPNAADPAFASRVADSQWRTGIHEVYAAAWHILVDRTSPSAETEKLLRHATAKSESDGAPLEPWLSEVAELFLGTDRDLIVVNRDTHPHLADHTVDDAPVIPVAYAIEWFARAATTAVGDQQSVGLRDVKVLNGVVASGFHDGLDLELRIVTPPEQSRALRLELVDRSGRRRYNCRAVLLDQDDPTPAILDGAATDLPSIYEQGGVLFHGPAFQVLRGVRLHAGAGLTGSVVGVVDRGWPGETWITDPGVIDGALQLALLWSEHVLGGPSLPTSISLVRVLDRPRPGALRATLVGRSATNSTVTSDVVVTNADGDVVVHLEGVETHALPRPHGA